MTRTQFLDRLRRAEQPLMMYAAALLAVSLALGFVVAPGERDRARALAKDTQRELKRVTEVQQQIADARAKVPEPNPLPAREDLPAVLRHLFTIADETALEIQPVTYRPQVDAETRTTVLRVFFPLEGSYAAVKKFLYAVETSSELLAVDSARLARVEGHEGVVRLDAEILVTLAD